MAATAWVAASCSRPSGTSNASTPRQVSIPRHGDHDRSCRVVRAAHDHTFTRSPGSGGSVVISACHRGKTGDRVRRVTVCQHGQQSIASPYPQDQPGGIEGSSRTAQQGRAENRSLLLWRAPYRGAPRMSDRGRDAAAAPEGVRARIRSEGSQSLVRRQSPDRGLTEPGKSGASAKRPTTMIAATTPSAIHRTRATSSSSVQRYAPRNVIELLGGNGDARDRTTLDRDENEGRRDHAGQEKREDGETRDSLLHPGNQDSTAARGVAPFRTERRPPDGGARATGWGRSVSPGTAAW